MIPGAHGFSKQLPVQCQTTLEAEISPYTERKARQIRRAERP